jgi:hypothetical protein
MIPGVASTVNGIGSLHGMTTVTFVITAATANERRTQIHEDQSILSTLVGLRTQIPLQTRVEGRRTTMRMATMTVKHRFRLVDTVAPTTRVPIYPAVNLRTLAEPLQIVVQRMNLVRCLAAVECSMSLTHLIQNHILPVNITHRSRATTPLRNPLLLRLGKNGNQIHVHLHLTCSE